MPDVITDARDAALAGLFDDAAMSSTTRPVLADALASYARLRSGGAGWMVNRFRTPVGALDRLVEGVAELPRGSAPLPLTVVLARAGGGVFGTLAKDLDALARVIADGSSGQVRLALLEGAILGTRPDVEIEALLTALEEAGVPEDIPLAVEVPFVDRAAGEVVRTVGAVALLGASQGRALLARARIATGATGDQELAGFLLACAEARVRMTVGPGLGQPLRSEDADGLQQGVLNVLAAAVMAYRGARLATLQTALAVPGTRVRLGSGAMILDDEVVESEMIAACREDFLTSIACTDIEAAVAQLAAMGSVEGSGAKT